MLTEIKQDGSWSVFGVDFKECTGNMYGALCRLRDYEKTGLNPDDFRSGSYETLYTHKVSYREKNSTEIHRIFCETAESAEMIAELLKTNGCDMVAVNRWSWQTFVEE
jgi:hypothetical protein